MNIKFKLNGKEISLDTKPDVKVLTLLKGLNIRSVRKGCDEEGKCGNCSVIINNKLINTCMLLAPQIEGADVITLEGLNKPKLNKIQKAFIEGGVVQCGYCTPAQILAVKLLLDKKSNPSKNDIDDALNGVVCRCTGYKQLYNVIDIITKNKKGTDFIPNYKKDYRVVGKVTEKVDAHQLVKADPSFVEDYVAPDALHVYVLRSPHPHAEIVSIDTTEAEKIEGVEFVLTHKNSPKTDYTQAGQTFPEPSPYDQRVIGKKMRYIGDKVAAIAATSYELAEKASKKIKVKYKILKPVFSIEEAKAKDAPIIHDRDIKKIDPIDIGGNPKKNIVCRNKGGIGDIEKGLKQSDIIVEHTFSTPHIQHTPMEPHTAYAYMKNDRLIIHTSVQTPFHVRRIVSNILGLQENKIRVIKEKVGGGFGAKQDCSVEDLVGTIAYMTGKPIYFRYTRKEEFLWSRTRRPLQITPKIGVDKKGSIKAISLKIEADSGGYGPHCLTVPMNGCSKTLPLFTCDNIAYDVTAYYTNNIVPGAYQGYGVPQANFAIHMVLLELAEKLNMSLEDLLRKNIVKKGYRLEILKQLGEGKEGLAQKISSCGLPDALEKGLKRYNTWKINNKANSDVVKGKGFSVMMQGSGIPGIDAANAMVKMLNDGTFMLYIGGADLGTGEDTVAAKIAAEELGVALKDVAVTSADTDTTPFDKGSYASSGTFFTGNAAYKAASNMKAKIIEEASKILKLNPKNVSIMPVGRVGTKQKSMSFKELAFQTQSGVGCGQLITAGAFTTAEVPIPYAAHFAEISINKKTGFIKVNRYYAIHDCGIPINPDLAAGQVYGAILKTIGHTFYEALEFDKNGKSLNYDFTGYPIPVMKDMPKDFDVELLEVDDNITPYVGKSISEIACNGASACIGMALYNALGIQLRDWPFRPEKILKALDEKQK